MATSNERTPSDELAHDPGPDPLARLRRAGERALRGPARAGDVDQVPHAGLARRCALAVLGAAPLRPHPGALLRLAGQRLPRLPLLRRAPAGRPPRHERPARLGAVRRLERPARAARLGPGPGRREPAAGMGRVPAAGRRGGDPGNAPGVRPVRRAAAAGQGAEPVRLGLVHPGRPDLHPAGLPGRQRRARVPPGRPGGDLQRALDSRRRRVCSSRRWPWPSPTPSSRPSPGGRSTAISCR